MSQHHESLIADVDVFRAALAQRAENELAALLTRLAFHAKSRSSSPSGCAPTSEELTPAARGTQPETEETP